MKDKVVKYSYYLMMILIVSIATYILIKWLIPLFFSCLIVLILQPLLAKEIQVLKIKNTLLKKLIIIINYLLFLATIITFIIFIIIQIYTVLQLLPNYLHHLYDLFSTNDYIIDATKCLDLIYSGSMNVLENISSNFITGLITLIMKIPSILFDLFFVVITSLFILLDYEQIEKIIVKRYQMIALVISTTKESLSNLFKTYFILMIITFLELVIGFKMLDINQEIMKASIIALFDFMPILGIDMIMIPWIVFNALINHIYQASGLCVLYLIVVITKNILEPRLLAKKFGVSPVLSLIGMYLGMKIMGLVGIILVPILLIMITQFIKVKNNIVE